MRLDKLGERNPKWKGNSAGYFALHVWMRSRKPKPKLCEICRKQPPLDLMGIDDNYTRNPADWKWVCRRCHMLSDGRMMRRNHNGNFSKEVETAFLP